MVLNSSSQLFLVHGWMVLVVFGEVIEGMDIVKKIEAQGSGSGAPQSSIVIEECGELKRQLNNMYLGYI